MMLLLATLVTVTGLVQSGGAPLPGVTVTLTHGTVSHTAVTNVEGRYAFAGLEDGAYDLRYELSGFATAEQRVRGGGEVPASQLSPTMESITFSCGASACSPDAPETPYGMPLCAEHELNTAMIEAAERGDRSAVELLRTRYAQTFTFMERHRVGAAVLHDSRIWQELFAHAQICVRFPDDQAPAYLAWCEKRELPPSDYWWASYDALETISSDRRSRALLREAVASENEQLAGLAVMGLAIQRDEASLPAIDRALQRFPESAFSMTQTLVLFASPAADALARKHLDDELFAEYETARAEYAAQSPEP